MVSFLCLAGALTARASPAPGPGVSRAAKRSRSKAQLNDDYEYEEGTSDDGMESEEEKVVVKTKKSRKGGTRKKAAIKTAAGSVRPLFLLPLFNALDFCNQLSFFLPYFACELFPGCFHCVGMAA